MKSFFSSLFSTIVGLTLLPLIYFSIAYTVTSEFIIASVAVGVVCWLICCCLSRHYYDLVESIGIGIVLFLLLINLVYSRVIVAPGGETNNTMAFLYIYWAIVIILGFCSSIKDYCRKEGDYRLDQRIKTFELQRKLERDD